MTGIVHGTSGTRSGSVSVRATEHGLPVAVQIDPRELRSGGRDLARIILDHTVRATELAKVERRRLLAEEGVSPDVLDRLGLPRVVADVAGESVPGSWLRSV